MNQPLRGGVMMPSRTSSPTRLRRARDAMDQSGYTAAQTGALQGLGRGLQQVGRTAPQIGNPAGGRSPINAPTPINPGQSARQPMGGGGQNAAMTGSVLRTPVQQATPQQRVPIAQVGQGPNAGGAVAPVVQGGAGQAGRPRGMAPHSAADALAANPMHYTSGLAQTRGQSQLRHPTLAPGPKMGGGGNLSDLRGPPAAQGGNTVSATPPTNRLGLPAFGVQVQGSNYVPPSAQVGSVDQAALGQRNGTVQQGGGGIGQTRSGLTVNENGETVEEIGDDPASQTATKFVQDATGIPVDGVIDPVPVNVGSGDASAPQQPARPGYAWVFENGVWSEKPIPGDPRSTGQGEMSSFEEWLKNMGDVPQLDRSALEANIRAEDQRQAMEDSRALQAMAEGASRAGIDAGQAVGMQGELGHQGAVERVTRGANQRLQATVQNFQAQVQAYAQRHQAAMQAAQFAQSDKERADAMAFAEKMLALQTSAQKELEKYQWELSKKMSGSDWLGLAYGYHMQSKADMSNIVGSMMGGI